MEIIETEISATLIFVLVAFVCSKCLKCV